MPDRQKEECDDMRQRFVAQDPQPLEDISEEGNNKQTEKQAKSYGLSFFGLGCSQKGLMHQLPQPTWRTHAHLKLGVA